MAESMLKIDNIDVYYGAIHALKGISLTVNKGEIVTLIGANGRENQLPCGQFLVC